MQRIGPKDRSSCQEPQAAPGDRPRWRQRQPGDAAQRGRSLQPAGARQCAELTGPGLRAYRDDRGLPQVLSCPARATCAPSTGPGPSCAAGRGGREGGSPQRPRHRREPRRFRGVEARTRPSSVVARLPRRQGQDRAVPPAPELGQGTHGFMIKTGGRQGRRQATWRPGARPDDRRARERARHPEAQQLPDAPDRLDPVKAMREEGRPDFRSGIDYRHGERPGYASAAQSGRTPTAALELRFHRPKMFDSRRGGLGWSRTDALGRARGRKERSRGARGFGKVDTTMSDRAGRQARRPLRHPRPAAQGAEPRGRR